MRPDVVWFGELPYHMERIAGLLADADLFISIGTSGAVYPAAGFVLAARRAGAHAVELNLEPSDGVSLFNEAIHGLATEIVPAYVERLLSTARSPRPARLSDPLPREAAQRSNATSAPAAASTATSAAPAIASAGSASPAASCGPNSTPMSCSAHISAIACSPPNRLARRRETFYRRPSALRTTPNQDRP